LFTEESLEGCTHRKPNMKTIKRAILVRFGILRDEKIHSGTPRIRKSVTMLKTEVEMNRIRRSTQWPPGIVRSQLNWTGVHCRTMAKKTATICEMLATLSQRRNLRTQSLWPNRRVKKIRTDDLTSARMGLYKIWTA
jgi:hypothetical protein